MPRTAIVTGSSKGIGAAIAKTLAYDGAHVILAARTGPLLEGVAAEIRAAGGAADAIALDLRAVDAADRLVAFAKERTGRIDVLVNNAGATVRAPFLNLSEHDWQDGFALKLFGAVRLCRAAWPHLVSSRGSIVNIAGVGGRTPGAEFAVGGSVNAALLSFTKSLAETGRQDGVQVNAVNPGSIRTERLQKRLDGIGEDAFVAAERVTRIGEPADIAALVAFVVGAGGRFLHGSLIDMDGGATKTL